MKVVVVPSPCLIIASGTRRSSRRCVAGLVSGGSRLLQRNYPASGSCEETLMVLRSSSTEIAEKSEMGWFVWFPRKWPRSVPVNSGVGVMIPAWSGEFRGSFRLCRR
ncbi:hypothetical protein YC2023_055520 [Brassica napus]